MTILTGCRGWPLFCCLDGLTRERCRAFIVSEVNNLKQVRVYERQCSRGDRGTTGAERKSPQAEIWGLFGEESRSSNRAYLFRRIAWRLQALSEGDLSTRARQRAAQLAAQLAVDAGCGSVL